ncbi:MAG: hypothetical protein ABSH56_13745 [Bryobacteraceae bacterium]|jgi:hypothetical protein
MIRTRAAAFLSSILLACCAAPAWADLARARAEPNLDRRAKLALDNAAAALTAARHSYENGDIQTASALSAEIGDSVTLAYDSLVSTGKDPRKSPRWFKYAEIQTRDLLRRLETFDLDMNATDRSLLGKVKETVLEVHEHLLQGLMEGKPK